MPFKLSIVNLDPWEEKISQFYREFCSHRDKITFIWEGRGFFFKLMDLIFYSISWLIKAWLNLHNMVKILKNISSSNALHLHTLARAASYGFYGLRLLQSLYGNINVCERFLFCLLFKHHLILLLQICGPRKRPPVFRPATSSLRMETWHKSWRQCLIQDNLGPSASNEMVVKINPTFPLCSIRPENDIIP